MWPTLSFVWSHLTAVVGYLTLNSMVDIGSYLFCQSDQQVIWTDIVRAFQKASRKISYFKLRKYGRILLGSGVTFSGFQIQNTVCHVPNRE